MIKAFVYIGSSNPESIEIEAETTDEFFRAEDKSSFVKFFDSEDRVLASFNLNQIYGYTIHHKRGN